MSRKRLQKKDSTSTGAAKYWSSGSCSRQPIYTAICDAHAFDCVSLPVNRLIRIITLTTASLATSTRQPFQGLAYTHDSYPCHNLQRRRTTSHEDGNATRCRWRPRRSSTPLLTRRVAHCPSFWSRTVKKSDNIPTSKRYQSISPTNMG